MVVPEWLYADSIERGLLSGIAKQGCALRRVDLCRGNFDRDLLPTDLSGSDGEA
jgi:hypothetical protein